MTYQECKGKYPLGLTFIYGIVTNTKYPDNYYSDFIIPRNINSIDDGSIIIFLDTVIGYKTIDNINFEPDIAIQWNVKDFEISDFAKSFIDYYHNYQNIKQCDDPDYYGYQSEKTYLISELTPVIFFESASEIIINDFINLDMPGVLEGMGIPNALENLKKELYNYFYEIENEYNDINKDEDFFEYVLNEFLKEHLYLKNI